VLTALSRALRVALLEAGEAVRASFHPEYNGRGEGQRYDTDLLREPRYVSVLALADDLTGALETGSKFARHGISTLVTTELTLQPAGISPATSVLVIDTESRHLPAIEAGGKVSALARASREKHIRLIYKKTDSTLRGNIGSELCALMAAYPDSPLIYVPAYPEMGRTVKQARLYVDNVLVSDTIFSRDALNPVMESHIPAVLVAQCDKPIVPIAIGALHRITAPALYVCDGECSHDVEAVAQLLARSSVFMLAAGPAGLAHSLSDLLDLPRARPDRLPCVTRSLVINGSLHELSARQVSYAEAAGWPLVEPDQAEAAIRESGWVILKRPTAGAEIRQLDLEALIVFGGDTVFSILDALGRPPVYPIGEVLPGVPVSRFRFGNKGQDLLLITKAGGFGSPDVLCAIRSALDRSQ